MTNNKTRYFLSINYLDCTPLQAIKHRISMGWLTSTDVLQHAAYQSNKSILQSSFKGFFVHFPWLKKPLETSVIKINFENILRCL